MRVVFFVDRYGNTVWRARDLRHGIDNKTVVLFAVIRSDDIQPVTEIEESRQIVFVRGFILPCQILTAQLLRKSIDLFNAFFIRGGEQSYRGCGKGNVRGFFKHPAHDLGGKRRP